MFCGGEIIRISVFGNTGCLISFCPVYGIVGIPYFIGFIPDFFIKPGGGRGALFLRDRGDGIFAGHFGQINM